MPPSDDGPTRRRFPRRACQLGVRYRLGERWDSGTVLDLTSHGCRLAVEAGIGLESVVRLAFERPLTDGVRELTVEVEGTIVWSRPEGGAHHVGVRFDEEAAGLEEVLRALSPR